MKPNYNGISRLTVERKLHATQRRLEKDPELKIQHHNFMKEYEELGHMGPVTSQEGKSTYYYLPHHPVFKETSSTTKNKVVFVEVGTNIQMSGWQSCKITSIDLTLLLSCTPIVKSYSNKGGYPWKSTFFLLY
jgi:hypothetical protein